MLAAIYNGLLEPDTMQPLAPLCSTGNCTFPTFTSMGFCNECCDVTLETSRYCDIRNGSSITCTYTLPTGQMVQLNNSQPNELRIIVPWPSHSLQNPGSCDIKGLGNSVASFGALDVAPTPTLPIRNATLCALFPCVQGHSVSVTGGRVSASILGSWRYTNSNTFTHSRVVVLDAHSIKDHSESLQMRNNIPRLVTQTDASMSSTYASSVSTPSSLTTITPTPLEHHSSSSPAAMAQNQSTFLPASPSSVVTFPGSSSPPPADYTMIQLGFLDPVDYTFVQNATTVADILDRITYQLAEALSLQSNEFIVHSLDISRVGKDPLVTAKAYVWAPSRTLSSLHLLMANRRSFVVRPYNQSIMYPINFYIAQIPTFDKEVVRGIDPFPSSWFLLSADYFFVLNAWFARTFNGTVSETHDPFHSGNNGYTTQETGTSELLVAIHNTGHNISTTMDNLAMSMSNHIRSIGRYDLNPGSRSRVNGTALGMETYVHVRWAWLTLPVICVISASFFLLSVILETRKHGALVWKSSVPAYLFHGLDHITQEETSMGKITEMADAAAVVKVRLTRDREGTWKLLRVGRRIGKVDGAR